MWQLTSQVINVCMNKQLVFHSSKFKDITTVLLESQGGDINLKTIGGFTPLMIASTNNEDDIVQFLCEYPGTPSLNLDIKVILAKHTNYYQLHDNITMYRIYPNRSPGIYFL